MLFPSLEEVKHLSVQHRIMPVFWEIPADHWTPLQVFAALSVGEEQAFLLESVPTPDAAWQRWSYIGFSSKLRLEEVQGTTMIHAFGSASSAGMGNFRQAAEQLLHVEGYPAVPQALPPFTGGFAGAIPSDAQCRNFGLYDTLVAYDHLHSKAVIIQHLQSSSDLAAQYQAAEIHAAEIAAKVERYRLAAQTRDDEPPMEVTWQGDVCSVLRAPDSFEVYRRLRSQFPAPYLFYVKQGNARYLGSGRTLADAGSSEGCVAGYWSQCGEWKCCRAEQFAAYRMLEHGERAASIHCWKKSDAEKMVELMQSAKFENTTI